MFNINGEEWKIKLVSKNHPKLRGANSYYTIGSCDDITKTIYINENIINNYQLLKKVLCHEITHAAMFSYNISMTDYEHELIADLIATYGQEIIDITNTLL